MINITGSTFKPIGYESRIGADMVAQTSDYLENAVTKSTNVTGYFFNPPIKSDGLNKVSKAEIITTSDSYIMNIYLGNKDVLSCIITKDKKVFLKDSSLEISPDKSNEITEAVINRIKKLDGTAKEDALKKIKFALNNDNAALNQTGKQTVLRRIFMPQNERNLKPWIKYSIILPEGKVRNVFMFPQSDGKIQMEIECKNRGMVFVCQLDDNGITTPPYIYVKPGDAELAEGEKDKIKKDIKELLPLILGAEKGGTNKKIIETVIRSLDQY